MNEEIIVHSWENIKLHIRDTYDLSNISYKTWIEDLQIGDIRDHLVVIRIPSDNPFKLNYISKNYIDFFRVTISELVDEEYDIRFVLDAAPQSEEEEKAIKAVNANLRSKVEEAHLNPKYRFDTFIIGGNNKFAQSACLAVAESPGNAYNPLFLYGAAGLGKTHLMQSIGHFILEESPGMRVLYVTSEQFTNEIFKSIIEEKCAGVRCCLAETHTNPIIYL